jgi:hypothetical protein
MNRCAKRVGCMQFLWISVYLLAGLLNGCAAEAAFALHR